jgi:hypothetical protein
MSDLSPATHRFNAGNKRGVRPRIEAAAMRTAIVVLAQLVFYGNAMAGPEYAVDGLTVGTQMDFRSASYREYKCNPSDQFEGLIWCQKSQTDKERRGSYIVAYSLLHSQSGSISYFNRSQEPAFFNPKEAELSIERYSRKFGDSPRITKMPHRRGLPDGIIAVWGNITLEPLDQESIKTLAAGRSPKRGFLIDYLRNFTRSAKEGLPIYRIDGGPGFIWAASFDEKGRGTLRLAAVNVSGFSPPASPMAAGEASAVPPPASPRPAVEAPEVSPPPSPVVVQTAAPADQEELSSKLNQTIEKLQADLAISTNKIAELESAKSGAKRAVQAAAQAKLDAENAKQEIEQARAAEKRTSDALIAQLRADKIAASTDGKELSSKLNQTIEKLRADLAISTNKIAELESAKSGAERTVQVAAQAKLDAENAKQEIEQARAAEKRTSDALIAQLRADKIAASTDGKELSSKLKQAIEKLQADLAISTNKIAELESAKSGAERALQETKQAKLDAENAKPEAEQARAAEKTTSDALIAQLRANKIAAGVKRSPWEIALYGSIGGVFVVLASSTMGFLIRRRNASDSKRPAEKAQTKPIDVWASPFPPGIAISETAFERDLEQEVAAINAVRAVPGTECYHQSI